MALPAAPLSLVTAPSARAFVELDERIVSAQPGTLLVRAPLEAQTSVLAHAARRLRTSGYLPIEAAGRPGAPLFREVATQLGLGALSCEPGACADAIAQAAISKRAALLLPLPAAGSWDGSVASELAASARMPILFVTSGDAPTSWDVSTFDVSGDLGPADKLRWLSAVAEQAQRELPADDLAALEAWWTNARRATPSSLPSIDTLGEGARTVLTCLALAGRSLPLASIARIRDNADAEVAELVSAGFASIGGGLVSTVAACDTAALESAATDAARIAVASLLTIDVGFDPDPWAFAQAAQLFVAAKSFEDADRAIATAMRGVADPQVAGEIAARWHACVMPVKGEGGLSLRIRAAQRALTSGEAIDAQRWCEAAALLAPEDPTISLLMGRALMQLGDFVAARVSLTKALDAANENELRARVVSELAEVAYLGGALEEAARLGQEAGSLASTVTTRLAARGTLGKIHLARGRWDAADEHFADDALTAAAAGETTAELRARLNRAIALLSKGQLDEAKSILERVLDDGGRLGEERARAYALSNLGLVAYRQHNYGAALSYWEQTIQLPQALRGRASTALTIGNLADLRLRLGLVDHAEQAIAFGRRLLRGSDAPVRRAHFKIVSAQVALARKNSVLARREVEAALEDAIASNNREYLGVAHLVAARIALEDGDLSRAAACIEKAASSADTSRSKSETAILRAHHLRASGQSALDAATEALAMVRVTGEEDLLTEVYGILASLQRDAGDIASAQAYCERAIAVRDAVAAGLPQDIAAAFLAKDENTTLARFYASLAIETDAEEEAPRTVRVNPRGTETAAREMVGDDPQVRSLMVAIRKVARANSTVLIRGESGTGKELVAEALHRASDRAAGPLVSVNCAALVENLLLSELFGHEKGAFTGASARRRGRFELAEGGTLFLDEIGDISARTQVALLRVLQEKTFERVGGANPIRANVRVICATHRDLKAMVERGEFREDLYYRLRGITLEVPSLRARLGDLAKIAEHLLGRIADERGENTKTLTQDAVDLLCRHRWPGNIRELENVLRAVSLFADGEAITATDLIDNVEDLRTVAQSGPHSQPPVSLRTPSLLPPPPPSRESGELEVVADGDESEGALPDGEANATAVAYAQVRQGAVSLSDIKRQIERDCIARALAETKGNITRAAALLGMKRPRLSQLVKQYGLSASSSEGSQ